MSSANVCPKAFPKRTTGVLEERIAFTSRDISVKEREGAQTAQGLGIG